MATTTLPADMLLANVSEFPSALLLQIFTAVALVMLVLNTIEVGRNDATNLVNAVFGARVLKRKWAVRIAGVGVVAGAVLSSGVIETVRKGIFTPGHLDLLGALSVYASVYVVNTLLLFGYSAFGMPVSTTATVVFSLLGAAFAMKPTAVNWSNSTTVITGIICSIVLTGITAFLVQRAMRGAIRDRTQHLPTLLLHGGWVGGGMAACLLYFMLLKGMSGVSVVREFNKNVVQVYGDLVVILFLWGACGILIHLALIVLRKRAARWLFPLLAIGGMLCMAFAFGQNDLANCASPGLATLRLIHDYVPGYGLAEASAHPISRYALFGCGLLLVVGMGSREAARVTKAEVRMGSMGDHVELYAPGWCVGLARVLLRFRGAAPALAPEPMASPRGKVTHYDTLRACVIMSVSACVIVTASGLKLPVSTTYVAFAAVVATGMADRIFQRGDAALKLGRAIWVIFSWFAAALLAAGAAGVVCRFVYHGGSIGVLAAIAGNFIARRIVHHRAEALERRVREEAQERMNPEDFAREDE